MKNEFRILWGGGQKSEKNPFEVSRTVAHVARSNVAVMPRSGYTAFRHVAVTPRFHVL